MYGSRSQQGRHRRHAGIHAPVGQHQDIGAVADRPVSVDANGFDCGFHALRAAVDRIQHGQGHCPQLIGLQVLNDCHLPVRQQRPLNFQRRSAVFVRVHNVCHVADHDPGRRNDAFPHAVNGRIRHLGKVLLEIIVQHLRFFRKHRQRRVDTHSAYRILAGTGHGNDHLGNIFLCIAEDLLLFLQIKGNEAVVDAAAPFRHQPVNFNNMFPAPVPIRMGRRQQVLDFFIFYDALFRRVDQEDAPRLQTAFIGYVLRRHRHSPCFRAQHHPVVLRHIVTGRAQAVPVQHTADYGAVAETDGRRAVPGFHHKSLVTVEILFFLAHGRILFPGLRNHGNHGMGQGMAGHQQVFQTVIKHGGIAAGAVDYREHFFHVREIRGLCLAFPGVQPVDVAPDGIDLAVVHDVTVGMRPGPAGEGVGTEPGMHQRHGRREIQIRQVQIEMPQLQGGQHAFIDDGPG